MRNLSYDLRVERNSSLVGSNLDLNLPSPAQSELGYDALPTKPFLNSGSSIDNINSTMSEIDNIIIFVLLWKYYIVVSI